MKYVWNLIEHIISDQLQLVEYHQVGAGRYIPFRALNLLLMFDKLQVSLNIKS